MLQRIGTNVGQTVGYGIGIAAGFVLHLPIMSLVNTIVVQQEEMDRVGVEPTTSAMPCKEHIATL
jgi:hypothetical protein